jgi:hypothetical protein
MLQRWSVPKIDKDPQIRTDLGFDEVMRRALLIKPETKQAKKKPAKRKK